MGTGSSSRRVLDVVDYNSKVARLREAAQEMEKQSALVTQLSQVSYPSCVLLIPSCITCTELKSGAEIRT